MGNPADKHPNKGDFKVYLVDYPISLTNLKTLAEETNPYQSATYVIIKNA